MSLHDATPELPKQETGAQTDTETKQEFENISDAKAFYQKAKQRLLNVNNWHELCGPLSADFQVTDEAGNPVDRLPKIGDRFKIDIPGPGTGAGKGYDWVQVEAIEEKHDEETDCESLLVRVRPAENPQTDKHEIAHFYSNDATSNFMLMRDKNIVTGAVHGRNEVPNTKATESILDKARNAIIGTTALAGISTAQWSTLVHAWLKRE